METKHNVGDRVLVSATVKGIHIDSTGVVYTVEADTGQRCPSKFDCNSDRCIESPQPPPIASPIEPNQESDSVPASGDGYAGCVEHAPVDSDSPTPTPFSGEPQGQAIAT